MHTIDISVDDIDALARTCMSEVGHFGRYGDDTLKGGVEAVVDTILNRAAHPGFPDSISDVVNARYQFSAIGGPGGVGNWRKLPRASDKVSQFVQQHLLDRLNRASCTVEGSTHFLNPYYSSPRALKTWGNAVVRHCVATWGRARDIHYHGFAPGYEPPPAYILRYERRTCAFNGKGVSTQNSTTPNRGNLNRDSGRGPIPGRDIDIESGEPDVELRYRVETVPISDTAQLQSTLNCLSAEGWRIRQILPHAERVLLIMEGEDLDHETFERDERTDETNMTVDADGETGGGRKDRPLPGAPASYEHKFSNFLASIGLRYFHYREFLTLGAQNLSGPAQGKNSYPPEELWENIVPTAKVLEELRRILGAEIHLSSVYRSPAYNAAIPGAAGGSMHMRFCATDFSCVDGRGSVWWAEQLKALRDAGMFRGGIGVYPTFVHVDTRGENVNFGPWKRRVFI